MLAKVRGLAGSLGREVGLAGGARAFTRPLLCALPIGYRSALVGRFAFFLTAKAVGEILNAFSGVVRVAVPFLFWGRGALLRALARRFALPICAVGHLCALAILRRVAIEVRRPNAILAALSLISELAVDSLSTLRALSVAVVPAVRAVPVAFVLGVVLAMLPLGTLAGAFVARPARACGASAAMFGAVAFRIVITVDRRPAGLTRFVAGPIRRGRAASAMHVAFRLRSCVAIILNRARPFFTVAFPQVSVVVLAKL